MKVLLNEPYYSGSHKYWADNFVSKSSNDIRLLTMAARHWKWRMKGSSIHLAQRFKELVDKPEVIICSSMMDVSLYKSLLIKELENIPIAYYLHENQLTYPFSNNESRSQEEFHYGFINYRSCLVADKIIFNSQYHMDQFLDGLVSLFRRLPDYTTEIQESVELIKSKSTVIYVGIDFDIIENFKFAPPPSKVPTLLWNHRWSYDKRPDLFYELCHHLKENNVDFRLNLINRVQSDSTGIFKKLQKDFEHEITIQGHLSSYEEYIHTLCSSDILPVSSEHDFYGISVLEALYCGLYPILPRCKVYEEFFPYDTNKIIYYDSKRSFFEATINAFKNNFILKSLDDIVFNHSIHNTVIRLDLCIKELFNVNSN